MDSISLEFCVSIREIRVSFPWHKEGQSVLVFLAGSLPNALNPCRPFCAVWKHRRLRARRICVGVGSLCKACGRPVVSHDFLVLYVVEKVGLLL